MQFTNRVSANIAKYVVPAALTAGLPASSLESFLQALASGEEYALLSVEGVTTAIIIKASAAAHTAYYKSFQTVYYTSIAFGGVAIISACMMRSRILDSTLTTDIARKLQGVDVNKDMLLKDTVDVEKSGTTPDYI